MAIELSKEALENIKNYKYETNGWTYMDNKFNPFWEFCVRNISKKVAPNLLTCIGIIFPIIAFIYLCTYDLSCSLVLPRSVFLLGAFSMFWYQTIDAIDGK